MASSAMRTSTLRRQVLLFIFVSIIVNQVLAAGYKTSHSRIRRTVQEKKNHRVSHHSKHKANHRTKGRSYASTSKSKSSSNESCSNDEIPSDFSISANSSISAIPSTTSKIHSANTSDSDSYVTSSANLTSNSNITSDDNSTSSESDGYESKKSNRTSIGVLTPSSGSTSDDNQTTSDSSNSSTNDTSSYATNKTSSGSTSSSLSGIFPSSAMKQNDLYLGFLPDDGSSGGDRQTMAQINSALNAKSSGYGWYSQITADKTYDGAQLLAVMDDVKACNCVFQPAVMPIHGWSGLTSDDNSQAVAIAKVMKKFTDEGIPVWLRFAHEVNYYQTDGTYQGTAEDFKKGWAAVSAAVKSIAPDVKMWWTPNVASADNYVKYEPYDLSTVDLVGIDFYPKKLTGSDFIDTMKAFHDKYAVDGRMFAIGETGLGYSGSIDDKFKWLSEIAAAKTSMPQFITMSWFNFRKEWNYRIAGERNLNSKFSALIAS